MSPARTATGGIGTDRQALVAGATSSGSRGIPSPATALTTTWSSRQVRSPSRGASTFRRQTITTSDPSTTAWLSAATSTVG